MGDTNAMSGGVRRLYEGMERNLRFYIAQLDAKLQASTATWKIVFGHHPMYTKSVRHGAVGRQLRDKEYTYERKGQSHTVPGYDLESVLIRNGVQAYFSGHEHC